MDRVEVADGGRLASTANLGGLCYSGCKNDPKMPVTLYTRGTRGRVRLSIYARTSFERYFKSTKPLFQASYELVHPKVCGPFLPKDNRISFPALPLLASQDVLLQDVICVWDVGIVESQLDLDLVMTNFSFQPSNCKNALFEVKIPRGDEEELIYSYCAKQNQSPGIVPSIQSKKLKGQQFVRVVLKLRKGVRGTMQLNYSQKIKP